MLWTISVVLTIPWLVGLVRRQAMERSLPSRRRRPGSFGYSGWSKNVRVCRIDERTNKGDKPVIWH